MNQPPLLYGKHPVLSALKNPKRRVVRLYLTPENLERWEEDWGDLSKLPYTLLSKKEISALTPPQALHQGFALQAEGGDLSSLEDILSSPQETFTVVALDQVSDPHNLGAVLRSSAVFGAGAVLTTARRGAAHGGHVAKTASGAMEFTPLVEVTNLCHALEQLRKKGFWVYGFDEKGSELLSAVRFPPKTVLVFGSEGEGLRRLTKEKCDELICLHPSTNPFSTLNVSAAAAIGLYALSVQRGV